MAGRSALGGFVEGLQGGISARDKMDLNKEYKELLHQKNSKGALDLAGAEQSAKAQYGLDNDGDTSGFAEQYSSHQKLQDPALMRLGKFVGGKIKGFFGGGGEEEAATSQMAIPTQSVTPGKAPGAPTSEVRTFGLPQQEPMGQGEAFADGGEVDYTDEERMQRSYGDNYLTQEQADERVVGVGSGMSGAKYPRGIKGPQAIPTSGGGLGEFMGDVGRSASDYFEKTQMAALAGDEDVSESYNKMINAESPREAGGAFTDWAVDSARAGTATAVGIVDDTVGKVARPVGGFLAGMVGYDGKTGNESEAGIPEAGAAEAAALEGQGVTAPAVSDNEVAAKAISEGEVAAIEAFDYSLLPEGTMPEDMPGMSTADWSKYRLEMMQGLMKQGMNPKEASQQVDDQTVDAQMRGMMRELDKASLYLQAGDNRSAAFAIRQGFQYFPNGVDVKFGMQQGKDGRPVVIAMGRDEETGEDTGQPFIITAEGLATMRENMSNPAAFRTWTKDGREQQMADREYNEVTVPAAQGRLDYQDGMLGVAQSKADTDMIKALTASQGGGRKPADYDRVYKEFIGSQELRALASEDGEAVANAMADRMARVFAANPDVPYPTIINALSDMYNEGGMDMVDAELEAAGL